MNTAMRGVRDPLVTDTVVVDCLSASASTAFLAEAIVTTSKALSNCALFGVVRVIDRPIFGEGELVATLQDGSRRSNFHHIVR